jgi:predicted DNA-binding protein
MRPAHPAGQELEQLVRRPLQVFRMQLADAIGLMKLLAIRLSEQTTLAKSLVIREFIHQLIEALHQSADLFFAADALVMGK